ncbi:MAG TPA: hypothetical protein VLU25_05285 [Acidobacteriota bacterium]|nr:hypothetical protein [Acidobacteriota bacterium]
MTPARRQPQQAQDLQQQKEEMEDILRQVGDYVSRLSEGCTLVRENFQQGDHALGQKRLSEMLEGLGWVTKAFAVSRPLLQERRIELALDGLPDALQPALEGLQNQDFGLVGDVLEYEVQPILQEWRLELEKL